MPASNKIKPTAYKEIERSYEQIETMCVMGGASKNLGYWVSTSLFWKFSLCRYAISCRLKPCQEMQSKKNTQMSVKTTQMSENHPDELSGQFGQPCLYF